MKIAFFEIQDWEEERLRQEFSSDELLFFREALKPEHFEKIKGCDALSVFIYSEVDRPVFEALPALKLIATRSTGFDHIDLAASQENGVIVCNVPSYGENTVAEHTFALILALSRNVHKSHMRRSGNNINLEGLMGFDLKDKTIGVIGTGKIGWHVAKIAHGFEMRILASDIRENTELIERYGVRYVPLDDLLKEADIITLHTPYFKETHHLINEENIRRVKPGAILINTARGELVDNDALLWGLENGILSGCGLDVIEGEDLIREEKELLYKEAGSEKLAELVKNHLLLRRDDVVYTPHIAFYSQEALERILSTTIQNIRCFSEGACQNRIQAL